MSLKWTLETGRESWEGGAVPLSISDRPNRIIHKKESSITGHGERCTLHLLQEIQYLGNSVKEKPHHPELLLFSNGFSFKTTLPNFLPVLYKITFLSFVCWMCLRFSHSLHILKCHFLLFPNKTVLLVK